MALSDFTPSPWMDEAFGDSGAAVASALARAAATAQTDGQEAKAGSRLRTNEPYGATVWIAFAHEVAAELESAGAVLVHPRGCRYQLAVVGSTLILAVKLSASSNGVAEMTIDSAVRRRVLELKSTGSEATLDFGDDFELVGPDGQPVVDSEFGPAKRAVLVVMEGNARGGVQHLHIGDVRLEGAFVSWLHREELPVVEASHLGLAALELERAAESFTAGAVPSMDLGLATAGANDTSHEENEADPGVIADES